MVRYTQILVIVAVLSIAVGCSKPLPSVEGYTQPSEAEARQFAEECATLVAKGRASEIMDHYDTLFLCHNSSDTQHYSKGEYEEGNEQLKEFWTEQLVGMLSSATSCEVKRIEETEYGQLVASEQGQLIAIEAPGKLAGLSVSFIVYLELIKKPDGQIVIYTIRHDAAKR